MHHENNAVEESIRVDDIESIETTGDSFEVSSSAENVHEDVKGASETETVQVLEDKIVNDVTSTNDNVSENVTNGIVIIIIPLERLKYGDDDHIKNCVRENLEAKNLIVKSKDVHRNVADGVFLRSDVLIEPIEVAYIQETDFKFNSCVALSCPILLQENG